MEILVIGNSNIFQRRILPALINIETIDKIHLATKGSGTTPIIPVEKQGFKFDDYMTALENVSPCLAYISLPNHLHFHWGLQALKFGFHVVIDKPAALCLADVMTLVNFAKKKNLLISEALVWQFHPQIQIAKNYFESKFDDVIKIDATFCFPFPDEKNYRMDASKGGGSFNDLISYASSPGRVFYQRDPIDCFCRTLKYDEARNIDTSFIVNIIYPGGRAFNGYYGFGMNYQNKMALLSSQREIILSPVFSTSPNSSLELKVTNNRKDEDIVIEPADSFKIYIEKVIMSIKGGTYDEMRLDMIKNAEVTELLANSAGDKKNDD